MDTTARFGPIPTLPPNPGRAAAAGHRRAHSETFIRLPDDLFLDSEPDFFFADIESPSLSDDSASAPIPADSARSLPSPVVSGGGEGASHPFSGGGSGSGGGGHHLRSLSVDAAFSEELGLQGPAATGGGAGLPEGRPRHRHSSSMDGWTSPSEGESAPSDFAKKAMVADKLAELSLIDPKRAKRILANRQSAARSKERKIRYTNELERKVQTLQSEATTLSAQVTLLQRGTDGLTAENRELKLRLQAMEQQAHLRDALNEALREELQRLKIATGQLPNANGNTFNRGLQPPVSPFFSHPRQLHYLSGNQAQQVHTSQQSGDGPSFSDESLHDSMDFM